ncbi:hypothetical protein BGZ70_003455 [Mortierella alpina]|uniref:Cation/H+ exchanger transmembrane domain-containing protein n=1 Tax=Mortierella alpina TaxID=64518 RepID=A0A9P6LVU1_MORAP|nr:hypothetical protein BGZ70_003455 [Mortierella alpina]
MVIAACVTPTDPVLSNSVVKGRFAEKHVPPRLRYLLSAESGVNDGMGLPFLLLGLYLLREPSVGVAIAKWFYLVWAYQILLSIVLGGIIGYAARKLVKGAKGRNLIDKESFLVFSIALALGVTGVVSILASDDLLACFVAGNVFAWDDWFSNEIAEAHIQEIIDMLLNLACFVFIGASIPFSSFGDAALGLSVWRLIVLAIAVLILRRLPYVVAMKPLIPAVKSYREAAFAGWFGPIGVGAVFFTKVTALATDPHHIGENVYNADLLNRVRDVIFPIVMFLVLSSVLVHGVTVPLLHLQYKYTRTWSRKREDSNHAVTRLPHINIGDEIILRPPTISGSSIGGAPEGVEGEQRTIGYDNQRSIGYDNQRSIGFDNQRSVGYDHQRSVNQRSYGYGGSVPYGGFGIAGVPDLSKSNQNTVRTLQDVVKEMKEASRGTAGNRNLRAPMNNAGNNTPPANNPRDSLSISFNVPSRDISSPRASTTVAPTTTTTASTFSPNSSLSVSKESDEEIAEEMKENHPAMHASGSHEGDMRTRSDTRSGSSGSAGTDHSSSSATMSSGLRPPPAAHARPASVTRYHEVDREEDQGVVRTVSRDMEEEDRVSVEKMEATTPPATPSTGHHHLTDLFKHHENP